MPDDWLPVTTLPSFADDAIQVLRLTIISNDEIFRARMSVLTAEEVARAERLLKGRVREQFVSGRWFLRTLLGEALGVAPREVAIRAGVHGKLYVPIVDGRTVSFNIAHSGDTVLVALRRHGTVGVDVECHGAMVDVMEVAEASFHPNEVNRLLAYTDEDQRRRAFYQYWTRKEAVAKADGRGMGLTFSSFEIPAEVAGETVIRVSVRQGAEERVYCLHDLRMGGKMSATVAVEVPYGPIRTRRFETRARE
ncbi:MAG: 4'-phosphopantetheinyl transferase superfamily protein [Granulicella sp.]